MLEKYILTKNILDIYILEFLGSLKCHNDLNIVPITPVIYCNGQLLAFKKWSTTWV